MTCSTSPRKWLTRMEPGQLGCGAHNGTRRLAGLLCCLLGLMTQGCCPVEQDGHLSEWAMYPQTNAYYPVAFSLLSTLWDAGPPPNLFGRVGMTIFSTVHVCRMIILLHRFPRHTQLFKTLGVIFPPPSLIFLLWEIGLLMSPGTGSGRDYDCCRTVSAALAPCQAAVRQGACSWAWEQLLP